MNISEITDMSLSPLNEKIGHNSNAKLSISDLEFSETKKILPL